jgi:outer membrane protein assembly factor BamB
MPGEPVRRSPRFFIRNRSGRVMLHRKSLLANRARVDKTTAPLRESTLYHGRPAREAWAGSPRDSPNRVIDQGSSQVSKSTILGVCLVLLLGKAGAAADWPQILGPSRNGVAADGEISPVPWGALGPKFAWELEVGRGFAGVAIVDKTAYLFQRVDDDEVTVALDLASGKPLWSAKSPVRYVSNISSDDGPRCTPTVAGDKVVVFGVTGHLRCLERATGKELWSRETGREFRAPGGYFGAGSTPLVHDGRVIVNVGGPKGAGVVAFALADGKTLWQTGDDLASYSTPVVMKVGGQERIVVVTRLHCVLLDPATGKELARMPFGARGPTVNAATPIVLNDQLFLTASYGIGATLVKVSDTKLEPLWKSDELLSSQYTTPVAHRGLLYGLHGRQDVGLAELRCVDPGNQKVLWSEPHFGAGHLLLVGDLILALTTDGKLTLLRASGEKYEKLAQATLTQDTVQALPAYSNGLLLFRDTGKLYCFDLSKK